MIVFLFVFVGFIGILANKNGGFPKAKSEMRTTAPASQPLHARGWALRGRGGFAEAESGKLSINSRRLPKLPGRLKGPLPHFYADEQKKPACWRAKICDSQGLSRRPHSKPAILSVRIFVSDALFPAYSKQRAHGWYRPKQKGKHTRRHDACRRRLRHGLKNWRKHGRTDPRRSLVETNVSCVSHRFPGR